MNDRTVKYIRKQTKGLAPSERKMWVERLYEFFRKESIDYVNGKPIPVSDEPETVAEAILQKEEDPTGAIIY